MLRIVFLIVGLGFLAACATLSEQECQTGDWYSVGLEDGAKGRLLSYFGNHSKACIKHGVVPDRSVWEEGRERGLVSYCTPQNAYRVGRSGRGISPVCEPRAEAAMVAPHMHGLRYYDLTQEISLLESEISSINAELSELTEVDPLFVVLVLDKSRLEREIRRLRRQRLRFTRWP